MKHTNTSDSKVISVQQDVLPKSPIDSKFELCYLHHIKKKKSLNFGTSGMKYFEVSYFKY